MLSEEKIMCKKLPLYIFAFLVLYAVLVEILLQSYHQVVASGVQYFLILAVITCIVYCIKTYGKTLNTDQLLLLVIIMGVLLRVERSTMLRWSIYQHDVHEECGHLDYIFQLAFNGALPQSNEYQYYHPPFHHILAAIWIRLFSLLTSDKDVLAESLQYLTTFYSSMIFIVAYYIFKLLGFKKETVVFGTALIAFSPPMIGLAASLNNDVLMVLLAFLTLYLTIKWYKAPNMKGLLLIALCIGLGMMTKLSMALIAPSVAIVMIKAWLVDKKFSIKETWYQFGAFGVISGCLGLWYPIRNYILFQQPFNYVYRYPNNHPAYIGDHSLIEKFFSFPLISHLFEEPYCINGGDCNVWIYLIKCSIIGEYWNAGNRNVLILFEVINAVVIVISILATIYVLFHVRQYRMEKWLLGSYWLVQMTAYFSFYIQYPFTFTLHFRYIVPTILIGVVFCEIAYEATGESAGVTKYIRLIAKGTAFIFIALSIITSICVI